MVGGTTGVNCGLALHRLGVSELRNALEQRVVAKPLNRLGARLSLLAPTIENHEGKC